MGEGGIIIHETSRKLGGLIASLFAILISIAGGVLTLARHPGRQQPWPRQPGGDVVIQVPEMEDTRVLLAIALASLVAYALARRRLGRHARLPGAASPADCDTKPA